jgi:EpsI family protein
MQVPVVSAKGRFNRLVVWTISFWIVVAAVCIYLQHRITPRHTLVLRGMEDVIPQSVGDWAAVAYEAAPIINPEQQQGLLEDYDEILSRTYVNRRTHTEVMLSIAYGSDQSHARQIHKPEVCYPAQGFVIDSVQRVQFDLASRQIPVTTLHATRGRRSEYIGYWIVEGSSIVRGAIEQNMKRMLLALRGIRVDGLLFRVSTLSDDSMTSTVLLEQFSQALLQSVSPSVRSKLVGEPAVASDL